jgi:hypothetical protein
MYAKRSLQRVALAIDLIGSLFRRFRDRPECILSTWRQRFPDWAGGILLGAGFAAALLFVPVRYRPFTYFQF